MNAETAPAYGLWTLAIISSLVFIIFAFSFARPSPTGKTGPWPQNPRTSPRVLPARNRRLTFPLWEGLS